MENASKALLIAGGILIAMLIIGSLVLLFNNIASYQSNEDANAKQSQIAKFNNQFEPFNKDELTLNELRSIYNKITSNNNKFPEYKIENNIKAIYSNISADFGEIEENEKITKKFKCINIEYNNPDGRISKMFFAEVN